MLEEDMLLNNSKYGFLYLSPESWDAMGVTINEPFPPWCENCLKFGKQNEAVAVLKRQPFCRKCLEESEQYKFI